MSLKLVRDLCHPVLTYGENMWVSKLTSIPIRRLHGKETVLFLFSHMRWCTGYGSFLCAFYSRKICIGVDFDFPGRNGPPFSLWVFFL